MHAKNMQEERGKKSPTISSAFLGRKRKGKKKLYEEERGGGKRMSSYGHLEDEKGGKWLPTNLRMFEHMMRGKKKETRKSME